MARTATTRDNTTFEVGDEVSYSFGSDSYPAVVVDVSKSGHKITTQQMEVLITKGDESQQEGVDYVVMPNENGTLYVWTRRTNGRYLMRGANYNGAPRLSHGVRYYRDPSF